MSEFEPKQDRYAVFSTGTEDLREAGTFLVVAHQVSPIPTMTAPALANCAFDKPRTLGLRTDKFNQKAS